MCVLVVFLFAFPHPEASVAGGALGIVRHCCLSCTEPGLHLRSGCVGLGQPFLLSELTPGFSEITKTSLDLQDP